MPLSWIGVNLLLHVCTYAKSFQVHNWNHFYSIYYLVAGFNVLFGVAVYFIPESPNHLMNKGQEKEAEAVIRQLDLDMSILTSLENDKKKNEAISVASVFSKSVNVKPFMSGITLMAFFMVCR